MKEKKSCLKIAVVAIFFVLITASAVQAIVKLSIEQKNEFIPAEIIDLLEGEGEKGSSTWEDLFNDASKIDTSPPGQGQSDNYVVEGGEVKMINTYSAWTDPDWTRMKPINITNNGGTDDYVIEFTVDYDSDMQPDYDDIRFKHEDDTTTWLDYWIEYYDASSATVWVEVPSLPSGESEMYLFYGNSDATSQSDFYDIFSWENVWSNDEKVTNHANNEGAWDPDVCYGNGEFLVCWEEGQAFYPPYTYGFKQEIRASIYEPDGTRVVFDKRVFQDSTTYYRNENPSIAYGGGKWFVAWEHYEPANLPPHNPSPTTMDIKARTVQRSGSGLQLGSVINVCSESGCQADANVEFDSVNNHFCVVWEDARNGVTNYNIYGRLYDTGGSPVGSEKTICDAANSQCEPWVAFDPINEQYMIVWEDGEDPEDGPFDIWVGLFDENLILIGPGSGPSPVKLADGDTDTDYNFPCVEFCEETERFLITYNDGDISDGDWWGNVWGIILDTSGNTVVSTFQIKSGEYIRTDIVPYMDTLFFVSYDGGGYILGKLVSSDGDVFTGELQISSGGDADWANIGVGDGRIFTAWEDTRVTYPYPWNNMPDVFGNIWYLDMPSGDDVTYVFGSKKELILSAHVTSIEIEPENLAYWDEFIEASSRSNDIVFDILDGAGTLLLHDISNGEDISGITASSLRLKATFSRTNPSSSPAIDMWGVSYYTNSPPNIPSYPSPTDGATNVALNADLNWTGGDPDPGDTVTYDVYFGTSGSPPKVVGNQSATIYDPGALNFGTTYYWKIVAWDNHGATATGPIWSFTTRANHPPNTPSSPSPPDEAVNVNLNADLNWSGGDPDPGDTVTYDIYFGTTNPPPIKTYGHTTTTYDPGTMEYGTTYYWKIIAWDSFGESAAGPIWSFTTEANSPPNIPSNPSPSDGATNVELDATLNWTGGDPNGDPVTYDVYFGDSSPPPKVIANQSGTTYDPGILEFSTTYYWKIIAWDEYGATATGPIWDFATGTNSAPNTPSNPHPGNGETNVPVSTDLSWIGGDPDGDPVTYDVYFGDSTPLSKISANQSGDSYAFTNDLSYNTTYYWQIVAWDNHDASASGPIWEFKTLESFNQPPNTPSIWGDGEFPLFQFIQPNVEYTFTVVTSDSDGDDVYYWIDWGDDSNSGWLGPYHTSVQITANHTWTETLDIQVIQVQAKDVHGAVSGWGKLWIFIIKNHNVVINNQVVVNNMQTRAQSQIVVNQGTQSSPSGTMSGQITPLAVTRSTANI